MCKIDNNLYNNEIEYEYDEKGQITKVIETINNNEYVTEYDYDLAGNVVSILTQDGGLTEYEYNMLGQLWKIKIDGEEVEYEYNPEGTVDWIDFPGESSFVDYNYNERNWVDYIDISSPSEGQMFREDYLYDDVGNLRNIQDMEGKTAIFGYDDLYRLKLFDGSYYGGREVQYGYDEVGNRELRVQIGGPQDLTWPEDYVYDSESNKLIETIIEGCIYDYDDVGNMIEKDCEGDITEYDYDINNLIEKIELPDGTKMIFQYDALGRRVSKKVSVGRVKTQTIYSYGLGSSPLMEFTSSTLGDGEPDIQVARPL